MILDFFSFLSCMKQWEYRILWNRRCATSLETLLSPILSVLNILPHLLPMVNFPAPEMHSDVMCGTLLDSVAVVRDRRQLLGVRLPTSESTASPYFSLIFLWRVGLSSMT
jgi:hypothetical protein